MPSSLITLSTVAGDNTINAVEATTTLPLSGTSSNIPVGTLVSIFVDGTSTPAAYTYLNADGSWDALLDATELGEGPHTITASVLSGSISSTQNVMVDTIAPDNPILFGPQGTISVSAGDTQPTFAWSAVPDADHYELTIDGGSPITVATTFYTLTLFQSLGHGSHTWQVSAFDAAGNAQDTPPSDTFALASLDPDTTLTQQPNALSTSSSATFDFTGVANNIGSTLSGFLYQLDGGSSFSFTGSGQITFNDLSEGSHTFTVRAQDSTGAIDTTPATYTWVVDTVPPEITAFDEVGASPTNAGSVQFHIVFSEPVANLSQNLFSVSGTAASGASVTSLDPVSGTDNEYIVTVATGPNDGTLGLTFNGASVTDLAGHHFVPTGAPVVASAAYDFSPLAVPIAAGDLNGDGNPDFVTSDIIYVPDPFSLTNSLVVHLGNGDGTFQTQPTNIFFGIGLGQAIIADFNNDGHPDLLFPDGNRNGFQVLLGNGDGTFQSGLFLHIDGDAQPITFAVADFNNDGRPDIVTRTDGLNVIYTNVGNGNFNADFSVLVGTALSGEDVSGDGDADLVYLSGNNVVVRLGNGTGNGTSVNPVGFGNELSSPVDATPVAKAVADIDGDHKLDVVTANADGTVTVMRGVGDGTFVKLASYSVNSALSSVVFGDFNDDGKLDIAASGPNDHNIYELLGDGHGGFGPATAIDIPGQPGNLAVADFNRDDGSDIVTKPNTPAAALVLSTYVPVDSGSDYVMDKTITASNVVDHDLVEATSSSAGTPSATATITIDSDTSYDTAALLVGGWTDAGGGLWTYASTYGTATLDTATGTLTFALDNVAADPLTPADHPTASFTIPVQDVATNTTTTTATFTIDGANDAPTLAPTNAGTLADTAAPDVLAALTGMLVGHDVDVGAVLAYGLAAGQGATGSYGTLSVDPDGHYRYTPNDAAIDAAPAGASLTDTFNVTVSDGAATTQSTLNVHVAGANDVPIITTGATPSVAENATVVTALTATDPDGPSAVTFTVTGGANEGLFDIVGGNLVFLAPHDYESDPHSYHVEVTASDGVGSSAKMLTVTLTDVNDNAPVFTSGTNTTEPENTAASTIVYTAHATDADATAANNTVGYSLTGDDAANFSIDPSTGDVRFVTAPDYEAPADADHDNHYQLTVHANDGPHDVTQDVTITVINVDPEIITGSAADDHFVGGALNDAINGGDGNDTLFGGAGDDLLGGGGGDDSIVGGDGNDTIWGEDGNDDLGGNAGNDTIIGGAGDDIIGGDDGNDVLNGGDGNDTVFGGAGDDQIGAGSGDDIVVGGDGNDTIWGEDGNDTINAGAGNDLVLGGNGADRIGGGTGDDDLRGEAGNDVLWGEDGNDTLTGGAGDDVLLGGAGSDTFVFNAGDGHDVIADFTAAGPEADRIWLAGTDLHSFADVLTHASFDAGTGATTITYGGGETIVLNGVQLGALNVANFVFS